MSESAGPNRTVFVVLGALLGLGVLSCCCCGGVGLVFRDDLALTYNDAVYTYVSSNDCTPDYPCTFDSPTPIQRLSLACAGTGPLVIEVRSASGSETLTETCRDFRGSYHSLSSPDVHLEVTVVQPRDRVAVAAYR